MALYAYNPFIILCIEKLTDLMTAQRGERDGIMLFINILILFYS